MKVKREDFVGLLTSVQPGLATREVLQQTQSFIFTDGMIVTYNDEISVRRPTPFGAEFVGAVKSDELFKLMRRMKSDVIDITLEGKEFHVRTKSSAAGIACEAEIVAPINEIQCPTNDSDAWAPLPENFIDAVRFCHTSVGQNMTRPLLTCIHFGPDRAESTDTFRITVFTLKQGKPLATPFLVPGAVVKHLTAYKLKDYCVHNGWLHLKTLDGAVFSCRTYTDPYPDVNKALNVEGREFVLPDGLDETVQRAVVFVEGEEFSVDKKIEISVKAKQVMVKSKGANGWFKEVLSSTYDGESFTFFISPAFLVEAYRMARTCIIGDGRLKMSCDQFTHVLSLVKVGKKQNKEDDTDAGE